jgi:hypothetical protein
VCRARWGAGRPAVLCHVLLCWEVLYCARVCVCPAVQVSYDEFHKLAKHPDPSRPDFNSQFDSAEPVKKTTGAMFPGGGPPPPPKGACPRAAARAKHTRAPTHSCTPAAALWCRL